LKGDGQLATKAGNREQMHCPSIKSLIPVVSPVPFSHQVSLFLEVEEKKLVTVTAGSPLCVLAIFQILFIGWRICLKE
jgi:hypothetical protein